MTGGEPYELNLHKIITHGKEAAVNGVMNSKDNKNNMPSLISMLSAGLKTRESKS